MFTSWLFLTLVSALALAVARILQKNILSYSGTSSASFSIIFQFLVASLFILYALFTHTFELPFLLDLWPYLLAMAIMYALGNLFIFNAYSLAEASEVSIIFASSTLWSVISASVLLGEILTLPNIIGIIVIVIGLIIINYQKTDWHLNKGHLYGLLAALFYGIAFTNDAFILGRYTSIPSYMIIAFIFPGILTLLLNPSALRQGVAYFRPTIMAKTILTALVYCVGAITIFSAYKSGGQASLISPISQVSIIFTIMIGYIFLGEKSDMIKKIVGVAIMIIGIILLA